MNYTLEFMILSLPLFLLFIILLINKTKPKPTKNEAPEPRGAWPIIGHLHLLRTADQPLHHTLATLADKHGPAFNIRLGTRNAFVVSNWEIAKQCFTENDQAVASRPQTAALKHMCYNNTVFGLGPYNPFWRHMKKIVIQEFFSNKLLENHRNIRSSEINIGLNKIHNQWSEPENRHQPVAVVMNNWLEHVMLNVVIMMVAGRRCRDAMAEMFRKAMRDFYRLSGVFVPADVMPFLWWWDLHGYEREMKRTGNDLDMVLSGWLDEHRKKREENEDDVNDDFMDVMMLLEDEGQLPDDVDDDPDTIIKATSLGLILGSNPPAMLVNWAISLLLQHPDVLKKLQHEIDEQVGKERQVDESDIENLAFLEAVIKETFRLYPPGPLLAPREVREDCMIAGYDVKVGSRLIINVWKLHRDERVWSDPSKFQPERFMSSDKNHTDLRGQQFVLVPFGFGRRSCPGATFALLQIYLTLARLVHSFNLDRPKGYLVDMTEALVRLTQKRNH